MAGEPTINIRGRVGADPEVRVTQTGRSVANFSVAVTPRTKDGDEWVDKDTLWFQVSCWRNAEAVAERIGKGEMVIINGKLSTRTYETKNGEQRTDMTVDADEVGVVPTANKGSKQSDEAPW